MDPTQPTPVLDSQCYPHILDNVIDVASPESLLALRGCSRGLHERADRLLFQHVEVVSDFGSRTAYVRPVASKLKFEWQQVHYPVHIRKGSLETEITDHEPAKLRFRSYVHKRLVEARVVDHWQNTLPKLDPGWVLWNKEVSRITIDTQLMVLLYHIPASGRRRPRAVALQTGAIAQDFGRCFQYPQHILHLLRPTSPGTDSLALSYLRMFTNRGDLTLGPLHDCQLTIIGGAEDLRAALKLPSCATDEEVYQAIENNADQLGLEPDLNFDLRSRIKFATPEEYERQVGAAQVALETKANPYAGPRAVYVD